MDAEGYILKRDDRLLSVLHEQPVSREPVEQTFFKSHGLNRNRSPVSEILKQTLDCIRGDRNPYSDEYNRDGNEKNEEYLLHFERISERSSEMFSSSGFSKDFLITAFLTVMIIGMFSIL